MPAPAVALTHPPSSHHIEALAALGVARRYRRGALLIQEGESGDTLYIVLQGRLRAFVADNQGRELTLGMYGPLEYVGEMSLDGGPRSANVEAAEASTCSVVSRATLLDYISAHPEFALELMARLIRRARLATESARSVALIDVYGRLVRLLNEMAREPDERGERCLSERMTHQQMAQHLACSREMVSRLLKDLETGGYIAVRDRWIWLARPLPARW
ncbi:MAG: Crp/Fnr family transcriptional regulator [Hydrogenophaga sp.]|uniref:Crp/Fnr family transcriptional regulator n=1 Tax=Hydrogenophaga sp. TaxID=1904254 RepID=UPI003D0FF162